MAAMKDEGGEEIRIIIIHKILYTGQHAVQEDRNIKLLETVTINSSRI